MDERSDQRVLVAKKVSSEAKQLQRFFHKVAGDLADFDSPFKAIEALAEVLGCDKEMLALDIGTLVKKYPDVSHDQLLCLLYMRNDLVSSNFVKSEIFLRIPFFFKSRVPFWDLYQNYRSISSHGRGPIFKK